MRGDGEGPGGQVPVQIRRFEGPAGVLALVEILASSTTDADSPAGYVDVVTGLPDRRALAERDDAWRRTRGADARFAVLFLDLDDFKRVNDLHGHPTGDLVLREAAGRWRGCLRDGDVVARYGGDEFVALIEGLVDRAGVEALVRRLEDVTRRPIDLGELQLHVHVTVGAALSPADGATLEDLIAAADRDMYARKQRRLAPHSP
jgi:diguanylate cyclase (GGDEF)-like protein